MVIWGLIPARQGSKRVRNKNIRILNGKPLIHWTVQAAIDSKIFDRIIISTNIPAIWESDWLNVNKIWREKGIDDLSPDIEWIDELFNKFSTPDYFAILRPTSPFRTATNIIHAWELFQNNKYADSIRAVRDVRETPFKMWGIANSYIKPIIQTGLINGQHVYNSPSQILPKVFVQCGALEIADSRNVLFRKNVSGANIMPYIMDEIEGFDINTPLDWLLAESMIEKGIIRL